MKPRLIHQTAMDLSFKAKLALDESNFIAAYDLYNEAAELESQVAEFYFDKPDLEPTRSVIIRSAALLNLKAGLVEKAQKFIFFGLLNCKDELIKEQLNNALEISVSLKNLNPQDASRENYYLTVLRQRSINYVLEPVNDLFGHSVSLEMIKNFSDEYLKSLKAYAIAKYRRIKDVVDEKIEDSIAKIINPLVTNSAYGSFKFSIANDFLSREGETKELIQFKSTVINKYHNEIFINPLDNQNIENIKATYTVEEVNDIFRPLVKLKSSSAPYKVGYYDSDTYSKVYTNRIINKQRRQLITTKEITQEDIGELENSIIHKRSSLDGKISKKTIIRQQLKSYEADIKINQIEPKSFPSVILSDEISINMIFNSSIGFTFSFDDFRIEYTDIEYAKALNGFHDLFYNKLIKLLKNKADLNVQDAKDLATIEPLIGNSKELVI